jgi:hypothetical protein
LGLTSPERPVVAVLLPAALLVYAALALAVAHWWLSGLAAPVVAWLLWRRHPRARFAAYVLLSVVALRGLVTRDWVVVGVAAGAIALLQLPSAARVWPRLRPGAIRAGSDADGSDRMRGS